MVGVRWIPYVPQRNCSKNIQFICNVCFIRKPCLSAVLSSLLAFLLVLFQSNGHVKLNLYITFLQMANNNIFNSFNDIYNCYFLLIFEFLNAVWTFLCSFYFLHDFFLCSVWGQMEQNYGWG